jgi:hypothetical protein
MEKKSRGFFVTGHYEEYVKDLMEDEDEEEFVSEGLRSLAIFKKWGMIFGFHVGQKTHRPHFHVYVQSSTGCRFSTVVKAFRDKFKIQCSVEEQRGSVTECKNYIENGCVVHVSEQVGIIDFGYKPANVEIMKKDEEVEQIFEEIRRRSYIEVFIESPLKIYKIGVQCAKEFDMLVHPCLFSFIEDGLKKVIWLYGESGSGKTYGAECIHNEMFPGEVGCLNIFDASKDNKWWSNCHSTFKTVIIDNVHQGSISSVLHLLISLAQGSFFAAEMKHHSPKLKVQLVCLTSVEHPLVLYNSMSLVERSSVTWPEVMRRIRSIIECKKVVDFFGQSKFERVFVRDDYKDIAGDFSHESEQNNMLIEESMDLNRNHDPYEDFEFHD